MQCVLIAAAFLLLPAWSQDLPVISVAGGAAGQAAPPGQAKTAGLPPLPVDPNRSTRYDLDSPRRLSLAFLEPRPIDEVLALLTAGTPFSVSIDADATGSFRGELKQLTLREALTTMLAPLGLDFEVRGTVIRVRRRQLETRLFDLERAQRATRTGAHYRRRRRSCRARVVSGRGRRASRHCRWRAGRCSRTADASTSIRAPGWPRSPIIRTVSIGSRRTSRPAPAQRPAGPPSGAGLRGDAARRRVDRLGSRSAASRTWRGTCPKRVLPRTRRRCARRSSRRATCAPCGRRM